LQLNPVVAADTLIAIDTVVHFSSLVAQWPLVAQNDKTSDNIELWQPNRTHTSGAPQCC
jgi:hypothetical protein